MPTFESLLTLQIIFLVHVPELRALNRISNKTLLTCSFRTRFTKLPGKGALLVRPRGKLSSSLAIGSCLASRGVLTSDRSLLGGKLFDKVLNNRGTVIFCSSYYSLTKHFCYW